MAPCHRADRQQSFPPSLGHPPPTIRTPPTLETAPGVSSLSGACQPSEKKKEQNIYKSEIPHWRLADSLRPDAGASAHKLSITSPQPPRDFHGLVHGALCNSRMWIANSCGQVGGNPHGILSPVPPKRRRHKPRRGKGRRTSSRSPAPLPPPGLAEKVAGKTAVRLSLVV